MSAGPLIDPLDSGGSGGGFRRAAPPISVNNEATQAYGRPFSLWPLGRVRRPAKAREPAGPFTDLSRAPTVKGPLDPLGSLARVGRQINTAPATIISGEASRDNCSVEKKSSRPSRQKTATPI